VADRRKVARLMDPPGSRGSTGLRCLAADHKNRPSVREVVAVLEEIESMSRAEARLDGEGRRPQLD
jgi:hypothetical protein